MEVKEDYKGVVGLIADTDKTDFSEWITGVTSIDQFGRPVGKGIDPGFVRSSPFYIVGNFESEEVLAHLYSFDKEIEEDCRRRYEAIREELGLEEGIGYCVGNIELDNKNRLAVLETVLGIDTDYSDDLVSVSRFLHNMVEDPESVLEESRDSFYQSVERLKKHNVSLGSALAVYPELFKRYEFPKYGAVSGRNVHLFFYEEGESGVELKEEEISLVSYTDVLKRFEKLEMLSVDMDLIRVIKERHKARVFEERDIRGLGLNGVRAYIQIHREAD